MFNPTKPSYFLLLPVLLFPAGDLTKEGRLVRNDKTTLERMLNLARWILTGEKH